MKLESELDLMENSFTTISHSIAVEIGNLTDEAFLNSAKKWAEANGLDEVYLLDSDTMMEVFKLGIESYRRMYGNLKKPMCKYMEFRDGKQVRGEWRTTE